MNTYKKVFGRKGEDLALNCLKNKGFSLLHRNFRIWGGEIDLIMKDSATGEIVFIEVKTRSAEYWQSLDETLSFAQRKFIIKAARRFLYYNNLENTDWRIDHVGIVMHAGKVIKIEHFENV